MFKNILGAQGELSPHQSRSPHDPHHSAASPARCRLPRFAECRLRFGRGPGEAINLPGQQGRLSRVPERGQCLQVLARRPAADRAAPYTGSQNQLGERHRSAAGAARRKITLYRDWLGEMDVDFAKNVVEMKDMWLGYRGSTTSVVRVGNYKEPFSLETLTSSKYITFLERSYTDNFSPDRNIGAAYAMGPNWRVEVGAFGQAAGSPDASGRDEGTGSPGGSPSRRSTDRAHWSTSALPRAPGRPTPQPAPTPTPCASAPGRKPTSARPGSSPPARSVRRLHDAMNAEFAS